MSEFVLPIRVYIEDTDAGGIVYYVNYLKYMERARSEWLNELGFGQRELLEQGVQLVVHSLSCRYARPARLDDRLEVTAGVGRLAACSLRFEQAVRYRGDTLCEAAVDIACIDTERLKPMRWPSALRAALTPDIQSQ
ncbi:tol-pal system-associated acyl-CoA thioesterase [Salinicola peritrichatus]|uniref:tol-pal system-associated acyl-CoA thioesterase n=1 Tax=Salinicola peritrichatus TaxID=1267424 RepID=UPI000DA1440E|nr:tol-pal system-associated acyl-CoA thioesterase [Salinicola peritrichatus]